MEEKELYGIAWEILDGHEVKDIEQHKTEQLVDKIVKVLARKQIPIDTVVSDDFDPKKDNEYAYKTIKEYEEIVGFKVNDAFKIGWDMARTKNKHLRLLAERSR